LEGELGAVVPVFRHGVALFLLLYEAALSGGDFGVGLSNFDQVILHIFHSLVHNLFWVLDLLQDAIHVGLGHTDKSIK